MASHKSAAKRARQTIKRTAINRARRSKVRGLAKAVEVAVAAKDVETATTGLRVAESALASAAGRGTMHWKTAARKTSRLAKRVKAVAVKAK